MLITYVQVDFLTHSWEKDTSKGKKKIRRKKKRWLFIFISWPKQETIASLDTKSDQHNDAANSSPTAGSVPPTPTFMHIIKAKHLKVKLGLTKQYFWMSKAILYTVSLSITTAFALHFKLLCCQQCQLPAWLESLGDGTRQWLAGSGEYYCMQKQLKKNQNALVFVDREEKDAGQQRYKIKKKNKPGTLPEPMFTFVIWTEWAVPITTNTEELAENSFLFKPCVLPSVDIQR